MDESQDGDTLVSGQVALDRILSLTAERDRLEKQLALERQASAALAARVQALEDGLRPFVPVISGSACVRVPHSAYHRAAELLADTEGGT